LIEPVLDDEASLLHPHQRLDRPHILFNEKTNKYVCWLKYSGDAACYAILTADKFLGPYIMVKEHFRPHEKKAGDFDICKDDATGKAYLYFDSDHECTLCVELTDDYCDVTDSISKHFEGLHPPFVREAASHFIRNGLHYLITSGLSGYVPNPSEVAVSKDWHGSYVVQGNPHVNDDSSASFNSQISFVFKHPHKKDLYIALADRWVPDYVMTAEKYDVLMRAIASRFNPEKYSATAEEKMSLRDAPLLATANTSKARYVWLPLRFEGDKAYIDWHNEWRTEDYE